MDKYVFSRETFKVFSDIHSPKFCQVLYWHAMLTGRLVSQYTAGLFEAVGGLIFELLLWCLKNNVCKMYCVPLAHAGSLI